MRSVARRFRVSLCTVQRWVGRCEGGGRLDRADLSDRPPGPVVSPRRTAATPPVDVEVLTVVSLPGGLVVAVGRRYRQTRGRCRRPGNGKRDRTGNGTGSILTSSVARWRKGIGSFGRAAPLPSVAAL